MPLFKPLTVMQRMRKAETLVPGFLVGIELEGMWMLKPAHMKVDISVRVPLKKCKCGRDGCSQGHNGEIASHAMHPHEMPSWVVHNYPARVNSTCGMHVHMSVDERIFQRLVRRAYQHGLYRSLAQWAKVNKITYKPFWERHTGKTSWARDYCDPTWRAEEQLAGSGRRTAVNFASKRRHGTLEIRCLPMFPTATQSINALARVILWTARWVAKAPKPAIIRVRTRKPRMKRQSISLRNPSRRGELRRRRGRPTPDPTRRQVDTWAQIIGQAPRRVPEGTAVEWRTFDASAPIITPDPPRYHVQMNGAITYTSAGDTSGGTTPIVAEHYGDDESTE